MLPHSLIFSLALHATNWSSWPLPGVQQVFFHCSLFDRNCNLELYQISGSTAMSSGCYVGVAGTGQGVEADPLTKIVKSPMLNPSNPPGTSNTEHVNTAMRVHCATPHALHTAASQHIRLYSLVFFCFTLFSCRFRAVD